MFLKVETNNTITFRFRLLKKQDIAVWLDDSEVGVLPEKTWRPSLPMDTSCPLKALDTETRYIQSHENYCSLQMARTCVSATAREKTRKPACPDHQTEISCASFYHIRYPADYARRSRFLAAENVRTASSLSCRP